MGTYNTKGVLLEKPAVGAGKAGDANANVKPTEPQISTIDALQMLLDVVGLIPGFGAPADLINGIISAARGDFFGAALSLIGVVPVAGEAAVAAKIAKNSEKYLEALEVVTKKVVPNLPPSVGRKIEDAVAAARTKIDELAGKPPAASAPKKVETEAPKAKDKGEDGGKVRPAADKVPCFNPFDKKKFQQLPDSEKKAYLKEMADQLQRQQSAINEMSAFEFKAAREAFASSGRNSAAGAAQAAYRQRMTSQIERSIRSDLLDKGVGPSAAAATAATRARDVMSGLSALHNPDMVAGGWGTSPPTSLGRADVNSSIGASWNQEGRLAALDKAADDAIRSGNGDQKMNVKLEPCRGKGPR